METKNSDGWIACDGNDLPVDRGVIIDIMMRNGTVHAKQTVGGSITDDEDYRASLPFFIHQGTDNDIVKYRISKDEDIVTVTKSKDINKISQQQAACIKKYKRKIRNKSIEIKMLKEDIDIHQRKIIELENIISSYKNVHKIYSRSLDFIQDNAALACALVASEEASPDNAELLRRLFQRDEKAIIKSINDAEMELHNGRELPF